MKKFYTEVGQVFLEKIGLYNVPSTKYKVGIRSRT
jgi:hypothetical protein